MNDLAYGSLLARRTMLLLASVLLVACSTLWAQNDAPSGPPGGHGRFGPERELQQLTRVLSLTADQQVQVKTLLTERMQKMEALRRSAPAPGSDTSSQATPPNRAQMEAIRNDTDTKISALLNDDQKTKFAAYEQGRKDRMARWQGRGGDAPPAPQQPN